MMLPTKGRTAKFVFLSFLVLTMSGFVLCAQPKDEYEDVFLYAQKLYEGGAYEQAELEYKRYIFLQDYSAGIHQTQALSILAELYEKNGQMQQAAQSMQKAIMCEPADSPALDTMRINHIRLLQAAEKQSHSSFSENLFVFSYIYLPDFSDSIRQYACLCAIQNDIQNGRTGYAEKTFNYLTENFPDCFTPEDAETVRTGFEKINTFKPKKQMLAAYLSLFPGLGQLYAHNIKDSVNAFLLNGSIIAVSVYSICTLDLWTFSLLEFNPLLHFMKGNIYNAQKDVYQYNTKKLQDYQQEILAVIEKTMKNAESINK